MTVQPRGFGLNGKSIYTNITKPMAVNLTYTVTPTNGLGITSLKSNGYVESVFMHTTQTAGVVNGVTNPNPVVGYALVRLKNNFNVYLGGFSGQIEPLASTSTTSTTATHVYVITSVGTTTLAQWQTAGLMPGLVPTVGQSFIAIATGAIGGTGTVGLPTAPSTVAVSVVGDPNTSLNNSNTAQNAGAQLLVQFSAATSSSVTTLIPAAPADNTVVGLSMTFDGSTVTIDGI